MAFNSGWTTVLFLQAAILSSLVECERLLGSSFGVLGTNATYDYVIIGGGTAGLTLANRLTEGGTTSVAVIEAGGFYELDNGNFSQIPGYCSLYANPDVVDGQIVQPQPLIDWSLITQPQPGLNKRLIHYTQGRTLGGGSARNYMAYHRPTVGTLNMWAEHVGDDGYSWDNVLPYYQKSPHFTAPNAAKFAHPDLIHYDQSAFTSSGGPLQVSYPQYMQPTTPYFYDAFQDLGVPVIAGLSSGELMGFAQATLSVDPRTATRSSAETSMLQNALPYPGLQVYQQTVAQKILFDGNKTATGVSVKTAGLSYVLFASKEVILSAGVFNSPKMLMLSGIGPRATLEQHNIPIISDRPGVGQNMWDQPFFSVTFNVNVTTLSSLSDPQIAAQATTDYLSNQTGPLGTTGSDLIGWEKVPPELRSNFSTSAQADLATFPPDWPELEILPSATSFIPVTGDGMFAAVAIAAVAPLSRGNVTIASTDINDNPLISPNWLLSTTDQQVAIAGIRRARQLGAASGIVLSENAPGPAVQTDAEILEFLRNTTIPIHHASATCAMGRANDTMAVVDSHARVMGVHGLRVVDASAFPFTPPGHIQSSVYMLAEKIADEIVSGR